MTQLVFSRQAELDLEEIGDFIAADNPDRAVTFVREIRDHCVGIAKSPLAYAARPEVGEGIRACPHGRYVIFFRPAEAYVLVVRILAGARHLPEAFGAEVCSIQGKAAPTHVRGSIAPKGAATVAMAQPRSGILAAIGGL